MRKCKSCGVPTKNKTFMGDTNPFNLEHCMPCASIIQLVKVTEEVLNRPNISGQVRNVKLSAIISKNGKETKNKS